jgi:UDP-N-acetylmuramyl pentapeptide phosphotransferase/UDP-N-acetylglucosamine-1-phosphate transferase
MHALPTPRWGGLAFAIGIIPVFFFLHIDRQVLSFIIAADYELMLRFLEKHRISSYYIDYVLVRVGGVSNRSFNNILRKSYEDYQAW